MPPALPVQLQAPVDSAIKTTTAHYRAKGGQRLVDGWLSALSSALTTISRNPWAGRPYPRMIRGHRDARSWLLRRYPYELLYRPLPEAVVVLHLRHHRQGDPPPA